MVGDTSGDGQARRLLEGIGRGDRRSMEDFYGMFDRTIYAFAQSRLNDPHAAADVVNEVMLAVWRTAGRFKGSSRVRTWVLGIAHHKVMDMLRAREKRRHAELDEEIPDPGAASGEDSAVSARHGDAIRRCLDRLTDQHRQVVHLAFFEDLSYSEIAAIVERPTGTVKTRMYHARISLKRCLEALGMTAEHI